MMKWWWWIVFSIGPLLGVAGAVYGTMNSIRHSRGPRERSFVIHASIYMSLGLTIFLAGLLLIPQQWNFLLWIPYGLGLGFVIRYYNRRQQEIREQEGSCVPPGLAS